MAQPLKINLVLLRKNGAYGVLQINYSILPKTINVFFPTGQPDREKIEFMHPTDDSDVGYGPAAPYAVFHLLPLSVDGKPLYQERD